MTEKSAPDDNHTQPAIQDPSLAGTDGPQGIQPANEIQDLDEGGQGGATGGPAGDGAAGPSATPGKAETSAQIPVVGLCL